jgi:hypothetical protein
MHVERIDGRENSSMAKTAIFHYHRHQSAVGEGQSISFLAFTPPNLHAHTHSFFLWATRALDIEKFSAPVELWDGFFIQSSCCCCCDKWPELIGLLMSKRERELKSLSSDKQVHSFASVSRLQLLLRELKARHQKGNESLTSLPLNSARALRTRRGFLSLKIIFMLPRRLALARSLHNIIKITVEGKKQNKNGSLAISGLAFWAIVLILSPLEIKINAFSIARVNGEKKWEGFNQLRSARNWSIERELRFLPS